MPDRGLVVADMEKDYGEFKLGPVSFQLPPGRAMGLLGSNGAGKTTLLAGVAGQLRLNRASVAWNAEPIVPLGWRHKEYVSYVRDVPTLYSELTVGQTVAFVSRLRSTWRQDRASAWLDAFRLDLRKPVRALSRGMKAKLGLLLAASHDVQLLLLDEVTAGVDPDTREDIQRFLRDLVVKEGASLIVSSHIFEDIEQISDDVLILRRGTPAFAGTLAQVQHLVTVTLAGDVPRPLRLSPLVVGSWTGPDGTTLVVPPALAAEQEEWLRAAGAVRRPASVRDLYFAYRERS